MKKYIEDEYIYIYYIFTIIIIKYKFHISCAIKNTEDSPHK